MANSDAQQRLRSSVFIKKKQNAAKSLNNYLNQLKIHFDLSETETIKVLEAVLRERKSKTISKKWWQILK